MWGCRTITDFRNENDALRAGRYGVITVADGRLVAITLRPWPKWIDPVSALWSEFVTHRYRAGDRCLLFYNQPRGYCDFLALKFWVAYRDQSLRSFHTALGVLEEIARIKRSHALLADVANLRISERLLHRLGWERHTTSTWHRNYIKRFYGEYSATTRWRALFEVPAISPLPAVV